MKLKIYKKSKMDSALIGFIVFVIMLSGGIASADFISGVGPITWLKLEESSLAPGFTNYNDEIGALNGACAGTCPSQFLSGQVSNSQDFSGDTGIAIAADSIYDWLINESFSIEFWMKSADVGGDTEVIIGRDDSVSNVTWWVGVEAGKTAFALRDSNGQFAQVTGFKDVDDDNWHHIAAVRNASSNQLLLYVDGVLDNTQSSAFTGDFSSAAGQISLGFLFKNDLAHQFPFGGEIDEFAVYDETLTSTIVTQHYLNGLEEAFLNEDVAPNFLFVQNTSTALGYTLNTAISAAGNPVPTYTPSVGTTVPDDLQLDPSGEITWTPSDQQTGDNTFNATATNTSGVDTSDVTVTVVDLCQDEMIAYWKLDENATAPGFTTYDDYIGINDGACSGACPGYNSSGQANGSQDFAGDTGIAIASDVMFDWLVNDDFSIEFWMKSADVGGDTEVIISRDDGVSSVNWWVGLEAGKTAFALRDSNGQFAQVTGISDVDDDNWHHVVVVRDVASSQLHVYVDGVLENSEPTTYTGNFSSASGQISIGFLLNDALTPGFRYGGEVDEIAVYGNKLPGSIFKEHYSEVSDRGYCNMPPVISAIPAQTATEGILYEYTPSATDPDELPGDSITWTLANEPSGMTIDDSTGYISWDPGEVEGNSGSISLIANDGHGGTDVDVFSISVTQENDDPVITTTAGITATEDIEYTYNPAATDEDVPADTLTWSLSNAPTGMTISSTTGAITWTPDNVTTSGEVTLTVDDGNSGTDTELFTIAVTNDNDPPEITTTAGTTATEDIEYTYNPAATDEDVPADTLTWSLSNAPTGMTISSTTGAIAWTPGNVTTSGEVTLTVDDGNGGTDTELFTIAVTNVNDAPEITTTAGTTATEDIEYTYNPAATDEDEPANTLTWSLSNAPTGMAISSTTGAVTWTPGNVTTSGEVTLTVDDGNGGTDTELFTIVVTNVNDAPEITTTAGTTATEDIQYTYNSEATDVDEPADTLTWSLSNAPDGMAIDTTTGAITWTPLNDVFISGTVTLTVSDGNGGTDSEQFTIIVTPVNDAPEITTTPPTTATENILYSYDADATDEEDDTLVWSLTDEPTGMTVDSTTGLVTWTPSDGQATQQEITLTVTGGDNSASQTINITLTLTNDPPVITTTAITTASEGIFYRYSPSATDSEHDTLTWALANEPVGMTINSATGEINWTPPSGSATYGPVELTVDDGNGGTDTEEWTINVGTPNNSPVITTTAPTSAVENQLYEYSPIATDPDGDTLTWSLEDEPEGMSIDTSTGMITWTPDPTLDFTTSGIVVLTVVDGNGGIAIEEFVISVALDNDLDGISNQEEQGPDNVGNYDGNGDGTADADQANVVTMETYNEQFHVTFEAQTGVQLENLKAADNPSPTGAPSNTDFDYGFFDFRLSGSVASAMVKIYLPAGAAPTTYYKYGKTLANTTDHWYEFMFDASTQTGAKIEGNVITLYFVDGLRGDDDLTIGNGVIDDIGAPGFETDDNNTGGGNGSGSGGSGGCFIDTTGSNSVIQANVLMDNASGAVLTLIVILLGFTLSVQKTKKSK